MASRSNKQIDNAARDCGIYVAPYGPGDGVVRYRFFWTDTDYFSDDGIYTALGAKEALTFLKGFSCGRNFQANSESVRQL